MTTENPSGQGIYEVPELNRQDEAAAPAPAEKLLPQSHVNDLIRQNKERAYQKGRQQALAEAQALQQQLQQPADAQAFSQQAPNIADTVSQEVQKHIAELTQKQQAAQHQQQFQQMLGQVWSKIPQAVQDHPDFDEVTKNVPFDKVPDALWLANTVDNSGHVLYELAKNPTKLAAILNVNQTLGFPAAAAEVKRLSDSIKTNQQADNIKLPPAPNSQIKPSTSGVGGGYENYSAKDFRNMFRG